MSYLLVGNISALICEECIEPMAKGRLRIYLPEDRYPSEVTGKGNFNHLKQLSAMEVALKADRLLAETVLDERGDFRLSWEEIHLFTEPLELDLSFEEMPGHAPGKRSVTQYQLSSGTVKQHAAMAGGPQLKVAIYNALNNQLAGIAQINGQSHYKR